MMITDLCEACKGNEIKVIEMSDDPYQPYKLCICPCYSFKTFSEVGKKND